MDRDEKLFHSETFRVFNTCESGGSMCHLSLTDLPRLQLDLYGHVHECGSRYLSCDGLSDEALQGIEAAGPP